MRLINYLAIISIFLLACKADEKKIDTVELKMQLMDIDRAFSKMSEEKGMKAAFMEYIDSNGVLLRPHTMPLVGGDAMYYIAQTNDSSFVITWEPTGGMVASSGDLGYTYGMYSMKFKSTDSLAFGTYVSIWKKQSDGKWKFSLDSGNEGVGEIEKED